MLLGIVNLLQEHAEHIPVVLNAINPPGFEDQMSCQIVWSPELYFITKTNSLSTKSPTLKRLFSCLLTGWLMINFKLFLLTSKCFIRDNSVLGFYSRLQQTKALILTGGGYINSIWWLDGLHAKTCISLLARMAKVPVILTSQGLGPYPNNIDKCIAKKLFRGADFIGVRDAEGSGAMVSAIAPDIRFYHTGDDSLLLKNLAIERIADIRKDLGIPEGKILIGVNLRDSSSYDPLYKLSSHEPYANLLDALVDTYDAHIVFVPISYHATDSDVENATAIDKYMRSKGSTTVITSALTPVEIKSLVSTFDYSIGISYHFLLFSLSQGIPSIGIYRNSYYQQKLSGLFNIYGTPQYCIDFSTIQRDGIAAIFSQLIDHNLQLSRTLREHSAALDRTCEVSRKVLLNKVGEI